MSPEQALKMLEQAVAQLPATRAQHAQFMEEVKVLAQVLKEKPSNG